MQSFFTNIICSRFNSFQFLKLLNLFFSVNICPTKKFQTTFKGQSHSSNINHFHQLQFDANLTGGLFQDWVQSAVERFPVPSIMLCFAWFKLVIQSSIKCCSWTGIIWNKMETHSNNHILLWFKKFKKFGVYTLNL